MFQDTGGYDMKYAGFQEICRNASSEKFNYLCSDMTKIKNDVNCRFFNENKNTNKEYCICESEDFSLLNAVSN